MLSRVFEKNEVNENPEDNYLIAAIQHERAKKTRMHYSIIST